MRKVVVTGATSFIAVPLIQRLVNNGDYVYAVVRPNSKNLSRIPKHINIKIIEINLDNIENLISFIDEEINVFYHLAWEGIRGNLRNNVDVQIKNYLSSIKVFNIANKLSASIFIGAGSQAEYGIIDGPITEEVIEQPNTEYGRYKLKAMQDCESIAKGVGVKLIWPRIFSVYGEFDYSKSLIMTCIEQMRSNKMIQLTECTHIWNYIYVKDVAEALYLFGVIDCESGVYNIAGANSRVLKDILLDLKGILESKSVLMFGAIPYDNLAINIYPKIDKIQKAINWKPETTFEDGINNIVKWYDYLK